MTKYEVDYSYMLPEWGTIVLDIPDDLSKEDQEDFAIAEIERDFPDLEDIDIEEMRKVNT